MKRPIRMLPVRIRPRSLASGRRNFGHRQSRQGGVGRIYRSNSGKTFPAPAKPLVMDQKSLLFQPHVLAVSLGATVQFLNSDKVQHNIFWPSISGNKKMSHNMGTWPTGEERSFKFDTPGVVPLLCNVHPEMSGFIIVSPTPYFAETDASGNFKIADVPDGSYTVSAWHEGMKIQSKPVTVSGNATVEFSLAK